MKKRFKNYNKDQLQKEYQEGILQHQDIEEQNKQDLIDLGLLDVTHKSDLFDTMLDNFMNESDMTNIEK